MPMRIAVLFSGGKDSTYAAYECKRKGYDIRYLLTMVPENPESYMFHYPNTHLAGMLAESMGIPLLTRATKGEKEKELDDLREAVMGLRGKIDAIAAGGIASKYQLERITKVCESAGLKLVSPLWSLDTKKYWLNLLDLGFEVMVASVACAGLGREWLGKVVDRKALAELEKLSIEYGFNLAGEGGEFETLVTDAPIFAKKLLILDYARKWEDDSGAFIVKEAMLADKKALHGIMKAYGKRKNEITKRLRDFRRLWLGQDKSLFAELCFCICTPQSKATVCNRAINRLVVSGKLYDGNEDDVRDGLEGVRFKNNKAKWIVAARRMFTLPNGLLDIKGRVDESDIMAAREWFVKNVKGIGYKEASHFLRNIGFGRDVAILDRHILKNLNAVGVIESVPGSITPKNYLAIEGRMKKFSKAINIPLGELDMVFWSMETGHVFK